jgi:hypothetical protein
MSTTFLLGPQRFLTTAGAVVRGLGVDGPVATITAGWEDREGDDGELDAVLEGRSRNLRLYERMLRVLEGDEAVAASILELRDAVDDLAGAYSSRLQFALDAAYAVRRRRGREDVIAASFSDAVDSVRRLDTWYLDEVRALYGEAYARGAIERSELYAQHRQEIVDLLSSCEILAIAGGHVGMLLRTMQFFGVQPPGDMPVVAWSAGAMVLTRIVVLFNDFAPAKPAAEVWDRGLDRVSGIVALPHARRRLHLDDRIRMELLARRFEGSTCLLLDDGAKIRVGCDGSLPTGARVVRPDGTVGLVETAA